MQNCTTSYIFWSVAIACMMGFVLPQLETVSAAPPNKVEVCHIPPDDPSNFHTIRVSENALPAHYAHGDYPGSCFANSEALCGDGDACTIDMNAQTETCEADPRPPVDCNDSNLCTIDSCDTEAGCQYAAVVCDDQNACTVGACNPNDGECIFNPLDDGTACDDGDAGTTNDVCTSGVCAGETPQGCPCWTPAQLETLALDALYFCGELPPGQPYLLGGINDNTFTSQARVIPIFDDIACELRDPFIAPEPGIKIFPLTPAQELACGEAILAECARREP